MKKYIIVYQSVNASSILIAETEEEKLRTLINNFADEFGAAMPHVVVYEITTLKPIIEVDRRI